MAGASELPVDAKIVGVLLKCSAVEIVLPVRALNTAHEL